VQASAVAAVRAWSWGGEVAVEALAGGLINHTWRVIGAAGPLAVLQRLNTRIFVPEVHEDIEAVTAHLAEAGLPTPRLIRTASGALWHTDAEGGVWRCLSLIGDRTVERLADPADAFSAGRLVGRFHTAVAGLRWEFRSVRPGAHDTDRHMAVLQQALAAHPEHRLHAEVQELAERILARWRGWGGYPDLPLRVIHGDLKISNVRFQGPEALALIDLDTFQLGTLDVELGDALRSWCNTATEDSAEARFDLDLYRAALEGYRAGRPDTSEAEWAAIPFGVQRIATELAARFAADALNESYFGWNPRFGGRGEHNLLRARGQVSLAEAVARLSA
jgi:Ser/Thr protein kinase RdoA (MazF antagonist)